MLSASVRSVYSIKASACAPREALLSKAHLVEDLAADGVEVKVNAVRAE